MNEQDRHRWNRKFLQGEHDSTEPSSVITDIEHLLPRQGNALDVAGGAGRHSLWLAQRGLSVTLVDISDEALRISQTRAQSLGIPLKTVHLDLEQKPLPAGPWDLILAVHYLDRTLFPRFAEALAPGGLLVFYSPLRAIYSDTSAHRPVFYWKMANYLHFCQVSGRCITKKVGSQKAGMKLWWWHKLRPCHLLAPSDFHRRTFVLYWHTSMDHDFIDKTVLITGAAGDIGRSLCQRFLALQANVYQTDLREIAAPNFTSGDVSDPDFVKVWINGILSQTDRIDVLLNVAGICPRTPLANVEAEEWDQVLGVNLRSTFLLSQMAIASMIAQKSGAIVNFASLAGQVGGLAVGAHYSASKAAIGALTKSLARTGAPHGVRVNAVAPGIIDTSMTTDAGPEKVDQLIQSIPMARLGGIDEVVQPIVFLASSQASYITGTTLDINGGIYMN